MDGHSALGLDGAGALMVAADYSSIFWIGGSPCAGKSSIARCLAAAHGLTTYHCDDAYEAHGARAIPAAQPVLHRLTRLTCDVIWSRPHHVMVAEELALYREEFPMILGDLRALAATSTAGVLAEGTALLPECVGTVLRDPRHAVWMVPSAEFQRAQYPRRDWVEGILRQCSDPLRAFTAWMDRDVAFARFVAEDAARRGFLVLTVDGSAPISAVAATVARHFEMRHEV